MASDPIISCERVAAITSGISCLIQGNYQDEKIEGIPLCDQFADHCASECHINNLSMNETLWKTCLFYSMQLHNMKVLDYEVSVYFVDSYASNSVGPPWNDTSLATCLSTLCDDYSPTCARASQSRCSATNLLSQDGHLLINEAQDCQTAICSEASINTDIAGNGVYIAYFVQVSLLLAIVCLWLPIKIAVMVLVESRKSRILRSITTDKKTQIPHWIEKANKAFIKIAVSFHKSQCTFALTLAITSTYLMRSNSQILDDVDQRALTIVVGTGIYPLSLMLFCLTFLAAKHVTAFTFGISVATWIWSIVIARRAVGGVASYRPQQGPIATCGGMTLPDFCGRKDLSYNTAQYFSTIFLVVICCLFWPLLHYSDRFGIENEHSDEKSTSRQAAPISVSPTSNRDKTAKATSFILATTTSDLVLIPSGSVSAQDEDTTLTPPTTTSPPYPRHRTRRSTNNDKGIVTPLAILVYFLLGSAIALLICFTEWISHMVKQVKGDGFLDHEWTFGQIVALMLWLPPVLDIAEECCDPLFHLSLTLSKKGYFNAKIFVWVLKFLRQQPHEILAPVLSGNYNDLNLAENMRRVLLMLVSFYRNWRAYPTSAYVQQQPP